jgi:hypothetical protein
MTRKILFFITTAIAAIQVGPAHASIMGFGDFSNFTLNQSDAAASPTISPGKIELTNNAITAETRSLFDDTPQTVSQFTASFTYQATGSNSGGEPGIALVLQDSPQGAHAIGVSQSGSGGGGSGGHGIFGYAGMPDSAAISLEVGGTDGFTGLFSGGTVGGGAVPPSPVNLNSGDPINVSLVYNGSTLSETLTDATTSATFNTTYLANLGSEIGSSTAFVGFTGANDSSTTQDQFLSNFEFNATATPEPSSILLLAIGGGAAALAHWRRRKSLRRF